LQIGDERPARVYDDGIERSDVGGCDVFEDFLVGLADDGRLSVVCL
jgi:hypothetical protein